MTSAGYLQDNDASRARLNALVARLSDQQLLTPMENDWTPAAYLAHVAFFDRRVTEFIKRIRTADDVYESPLDVHVLNDALLPQWRKLAPRVAAEDAVEAATEADAAVATLSPEIVERVRDLKAFAVNRSTHRTLHVNEMEALLA